MSSSSGTLRILKRTITHFSDDDCPMMAAALAYYTAFSLPPLFVLIITVAGLIWSADAVEGQLETQVTSVIGEGAWQQIQTMMEAAREHQQGMVAALIGIGALLFGATGVMVQLQAALNKTWEVQPDPDQGGVKNFLTKRLLSLAMIIAVTFLLLVSLVLTTVLNAMADVVSGWLPAGVATWVPLAVNFAVSFFIFTLLFAGMFKWLPDANVCWRDTWIGAIATALLFMAGKLLLALYFSRSDTGGYGAASSLVLLLVWVYYSSMIFLLGAEFTQVWASRHGRPISPDDGAVRVIHQTKRVDESGTGDDGPHTGDSAVGTAPPDSSG